MTRHQALAGSFQKSDARYAANVERKGMIMRVKKSSRFYDRALAEIKARPPNHEKALSLLERAHRAGDPRATYALGTWWLHGHVVGRDIKKGLAMIRWAASAGIPEAHFDLAVSLELGEGIRKNTTAAAHHYLRAALSGDSQAVFEVGRCLYWGIGLAKDRRNAQAWFDKAAELGTYDSVKRRPREDAPGR